eukprot:CAMPEP_0113298222 /NCGR_PEP_ID=MMETSP0010_2-20120614/759_1 /TAXON_ID=216773 ORGANISM="Corethron hystrix, Strain 308" /NCGR_SAMPLE_ID=MMETSP0010_2 /ASSEMBLY_ACC=CAM_ASM_000155 /LENGTH=322 /DNA_ID=CAMNT_0000151245 /DNA_START=52 /DNA_END=1020 /DNA_ORIENTATION=- /assembly_acc=CAM_ASM_000155
MASLLIRCLASISMLCQLLAAASFVSTARFHFGRKDPGRFRSLASHASVTDDVISRLVYRPAKPQDISACIDIETASYPEDEAASLASLEYRQHNASPYFRCALLDNVVIGFVCATRCDRFEEESMTKNLPDGCLLAVHSVVVREDFRRRSIGTAMLRNYLEQVGGDDTEGNVRSVVLLAKQNLLGFYVKCGFVVMRPSPIVHGKELWYKLKHDLVRTLPVEGKESWFCKTEQFKRPFPEIKPHLEAHKEWVASLRREGFCITSGYRVDSKGRPGGGGLMFLAAKTYDDALSLILQDPLVANDCVDWELNGWIGQVGDIQLR